MEVMQEFQTGNCAVDVSILNSRRDATAVDSKGESTLGPGSMFDPRQQIHSKKEESSRGQMMARGGQRGDTATEEDYSANFTANEMASTPVIPQNESNSAYSMPVTATEQLEDEEDDVT